MIGPNSSYVHFYSQTMKTGNSFSIREAVSIIQVLLQSTRRLLSELDSLRNKFVQQLGLNKSTGRLVMMIEEKDYDPESVVQKTIWKYRWRDSIIEVCMDEIQRKLKELPVELSEKEPKRTVYKASLYKEAWLDRFTQNLGLSLDEAPNWDIRSFLASPDEDIKSLMATAKEFSEILSSHFPVYWNNRNTSLV